MTRSPVPDHGPSPAALTTLRGATTARALGYGRVITGRGRQGRRRATAQRAVLDAASSLVAERGVRALTPAAVGAAAGYPRRSVMARFGSRAGLLDALTKDLQDRFEPPESGTRG